MTGALATGTLAAGATYFLPGGSLPPSVTIRFVTGSDPTGSRDLLIAMWNNANPRATVTVDEVGGDSTRDQRDAMESRAANGAADLLNLDVINIPYFRDKGYLETIQLENVEEFLPNTLIASRQSAPRATEFWAAPYLGDAGMIYERLPPSVLASGSDVPPLATLVDQIVPPGSGQLAGQLKRSSTVSREAFVVNVLEHALSRDPTILDPMTGLPALAVERWQAALVPLRTALAVGRIDAGDTEKSSRDSFRIRRLGFMRNWPTEYRNLQIDGDLDARTLHLNVGTLPNAVLGGGGLAVCSKAAQPDRAADFARFLTSAPAQRVLAAYAIAPTRGGVYEDVETADAIPHLKNVRAAIENARPRPVNAGYREFSDEMFGFFSSFLDGRDFTTELVAAMRRTLRLP